MSAMGSMMIVFKTAYVEFKVALHTDTSPFSIGAGFLHVNGIPIFPGTWR